MAYYWLRKELENKEQSLQERFNNLQQNISAANEKMDSYKLNMKNILEELEQWAMAARQKEDDKMHIEQYYRIDELHIKDIMLQIEKLTQEVNIKMHELEKEVTETQARQIEMEKTTEELKKLQIERQRLLDDVMRTQETIKILSDELRRQCDIYFTNKVELGEQKESLEKKVKEYDERVKSNKQEEEENKKQEAKLSKSRGDLVKLEKDFNEIHNEIEIKKNELSALARELTNKTNYTNVIKNDLEKKSKEKIEEDLIISAVSETFYYVQEYVIKIVYMNIIKVEKKYQKYLQKLMNSKNLLKNYLKIFRTNLNFWNCRKLVLV